MKIVSPFLKNILYPSLSAAGIFRRTSAPGLAIVTYHGVLPRGYEPIDVAFDGNLVSVETLRRQLRQLRTTFKVISPQQALAWRRGKFDLPPRALLVTCDDGLLNTLTDMLPVLQQEEVPCLFFVTGASARETRSVLWYEELFVLLLKAPSGEFDLTSNGITLRAQLRSLDGRRTAWWRAVKRLSQLDEQSRRAFVCDVSKKVGIELNRNWADHDSPAGRRFGLLTLSELCSLATSGMTIGAHTMSHPMLSQMAPELARAEIANCRAVLESALQKEVWAFAYPFGDAASVTAEVLNMPREAAYSAAFLNFGGGLGVSLPPWALPRVHVTSGMSLSELEAHLSGFYARLQHRAGRSSPTFAAA